MKFIIAPHDNMNSSEQLDEVSVLPVNSETISSSVCWQHLFVVWQPVESFFPYQTICRRCRCLGSASAPTVSTQLEKPATFIRWKYWFWACRIWTEVHFEPHLDQCNLGAQWYFRCNLSAALEELAESNGKLERCRFWKHINVS